NTPARKVQGFCAIYFSFFSQKRPFFIFSHEKGQPLFVFSAVLSVFAIICEYKTYPVTSRHGACGKAQKSPANARFLRSRGVCSVTVG
ncbi:MAG: hypothetical protein IJM71_01090, partial [Clostridia bacterium]|nr:hypothetical protein [Clostridia bacterium]